MCKSTLSTKKGTVRNSKHAFENIPRRLQAARGHFAFQATQIGCYQPRASSDDGPSDPNERHQGIGWHLGPGRSQRGILLAACEQRRFPIDRSLPDQSAGKSMTATDSCPPVSDIIVSLVVTLGYQASSPRARSPAGSASLMPFTPKVASSSVSYGMSAGRQSRVSLTDSLVSVPVAFPLKARLWMDLTTSRRLPRL